MFDYKITGLTQLCFAFYYMTFLKTSNSKGRIFYCVNENYRKMFNHTITAGDNNHTDKDCIFNKHNEIVDTSIVPNMVYGTIGVLAFTNNLVFCVAMKRKKKTLQSCYDLLIYSLAIADMFTGKKTSFCCIVRISSSINSNHARLAIV